MDLKALETALDYRFKAHENVAMALTHASAYTGSEGVNYERLEFLGDRVVNLIVADLLYQTFPDEAEGAMAKRHSALVQTETLADMARDLGLNDHVILSQSESLAGGTANDNILADIMEAVTAAIYLDGGFEAAREFFTRALGDRLHVMVEPPRDPKTTLQEWSQARNLGLPTYDIIAQTGPDHAPEFTVQVSLDGLPPQQATSNSKKRAEKDAAQKMLESF